MKKEMLIMASACLMSCQNVLLSEQQQKVKQYTIEQIHESIALSMEDVDRIDVAPVPDTIISDLPLSWRMIDANKTMEAYYKGKITEDSVVSFLLKYERDIFHVRLAAEYGANDSIKAVYQNRYHTPSYPVEVVMKSGQVRKVEVLLGTDGNPYKFRHKFIEDLQQYDKFVMSLYNQLY